MGKTVPSYRMALKFEISRWKGFRNALEEEINLGNSVAMARFFCQTIKLYTQLVYIIALVYTVTEVLSVRVKKSLKDEAEKLGVDLKAAVEQLLEELVSEKKAKAQKVAKELSSLMDVKAEEWVNDVKATRHKM